eukprot:TRINITY_DN19562_c0_g1_i1.p2 TRINITY_DN19562_c0_g1~~TRINITY_DN19562_c0_g1_i1.p2  ORF type:complete len:129 (+),score=7.16 TRINITY_DN19562_c0_g1_i1:787-1173(+)
MGVGWGQGALRELSLSLSGGDHLPSINVVCTEGGNRLPERRTGQEIGLVPPPTGVAARNSLLAKGRAQKSNCDSNGGKQQNFILMVGRMDVAGGYKEKTSFVTRRSFLNSFTGCGVYYTRLADTVGVQ